MDSFPDQGAGDAAHAVTKALVGMVPVAGSALTVLLETVLAPPLERRREKWFRMLGAAVEQLQQTVDGLTTEALSENDVFITVVAQATQVALRTHQDEKLNALKAAVLNSGLPNPPADDLQLMYVRFIDELSPWHIRLLDLFSGPEQWMQRNGVNNPGWAMGGPSTVIEHCFPALKNEREFYEQIVRDLQSRGLIHQGQFLNTTMTDRGMVQARTSGLANAFLAFVARGAV
jgi:hypothetical protein